MTIYTLLKTFLLLLIFAYAAPVLLMHIKQYYNTIFEPHTHIGLITVNNGLIDSASYIEKLNYFFKNPLIKALVLKINCHDCAAGSSQIIFHEIQSLKKIYPKPIIGLIENECFSGAYLIASSCDTIVAPETALFGKIGLYTLPDYFQQNIHTDESIYKEIYQQTTKHIATARRLSLATVNNWAHENSITGRQALHVGLIDIIGSLYTVETLIRSKTLCDEHISWITYTKNSYTFPISISLFETSVQ